MYDDTYTDDTPMMDDPSGGGSGSGSGYNYQLYVSSSVSATSVSSFSVSGTNQVAVNNSKVGSQCEQVNVVSDTPSFSVTVGSGSNTYGSGNKFYIDTAVVPSLRDIVTDSATYRFDQSHASNAGHPIAFSTTPDGVHETGSEYTSGVTSVGTPGTSGAYTEVTITQNSTPFLYYYCQNHSGMGSDPWSSEGFTGELNATPVSSIYGWTAGSLSSPSIYYSRLGVFNTVADPSTTWAQLSIPSDGHLAFNYNADSSDERVYVYKNGLLQQTLTYNGDLESETAGPQGSFALAVAEGDVIKWAFESIYYTAWIDDISLSLAGVFSISVASSQVISEALSPMIYLTRKVTRTANFW